MPGTTVLSENVLSAISIIISFFLIILVVHTVFSQRASRTYSEIFQSLGREIAISIDRVVATPGSAMIEQEIPKGLKMNLTIDYKSVFITYDGKTIKKGFSGLINSGPYSFMNPEVLCVVKNRDENKVIITDKPCKLER